MCGRGRVPAPFLAPSPSVLVLLAFPIPSDIEQDRSPQGTGGEGVGVLRADIGTLLSQGEDALLRVGAVDLGQGQLVPQVLKDLGAQVTGGEGVGVLRADIGACSSRARMPFLSSVPSISARASS